MSQMTLYSYVVFNTLVESESFIKASDVLQLTPSAISHMIMKMENEFGYKLIIRDRRGARLTENGKLLLPHIRNLLNCNNALEQEISNIKNIESGVVRVASFYSVTAYWLPKIITTFNQLYPNIKIIVLQSGDMEIKHWIKNGDVDLAFASKGFVDDFDSFIPLHNSPLVCVTPIGYKPPNGVSMSVEDLKQLPLIFQLAGYDTEISAFLKRNNLPLESNYRVETDDAVFALVEAGLGCAISPNMTVLGNNRQLNIYPLFPTTYRTVGLATIYPQLMAPATKLLRQHILRFMEDAGLMNV